MLEDAVGSVAVALIVQVGAEWEETRASFVFWSMCKVAVLSSTAPVGQLLASHLWHVGRL